MRSSRRPAAVAVLLATAFAGTPALLPSAGAADDRAGDRAIARAADKYGVSEAGLRARVAKDPGFRLTSSGLAYVVDPAPATPPEPVRTIAQAFPLSDTFKLHSKPDSKRTIYLDFNGGDVSNTLWNGPAGNNLPDGAHPAMDLGSNGAAFTDLELAQVQDIYQRVAEDYAPFDVDVTTEQPPAADLDRTGSGDQVYGTRALITSGTNALSTICGGSCGGIAFIGVFNHHQGKDGYVETHNQLQPAWVFAQGLGNDPKSIAEATTHEVGHTLGLDHDGTNSQGYYDGGGNASTPGNHNGWAPIMGVGYIHPLVHFALNDYPDANLGGPGTDSAQPNPDDLATIDGYLSSAASDLRTDEAGGSIAAAGAVPGGSAYITSRNDVDVFALGTCSGTVTVAANNAPVSPNLDLEVQLLDAGGTTVATDNPPSARVNRDSMSGLDASVTKGSLPSGRYYARVDGVGRGNATSGYTDYASLGSYTLAATGCDGAGGIAPSKPGKARIGKAKAGAKGGKLTATVSWQPPAGTTTPAITGWQLLAYRKNSKGRYVQASTATFSTGTRGARFSTNRRGSYKFAVRARNALGYGPLSARSNAVAPR